MPENPPSASEKRVPLILHPVLFGLFPVLHLYLVNCHRMPRVDLGAPLLFSIFFTFISWFVIQRFDRNLERAALIATFFIIFFFSFGHVYYLLENLRDKGLLWGRLRFVYPAYVLSFVFLSTSMFGSRIPLRRLRIGFNLGGIALLTFCMLGITIYFTGPGNVDWRKETGTKALEASPNAPPLPQKPHIFYIILDGYARSDFLKTSYGFDNSSFLEGLHSLGFQIAGRSHSNYPITRMSLSSSLNSLYLKYPPAFKDSLSQTALPRKMLRDNRTMRFLQDRGYDFAAFSSGYSFTELPTADLYLKSRVLPCKFEETFIRTLAIWPLVATPSNNPFDTILRKRFFFIQETLPTISRREKPTFVFAHFLVTHPPFVFQEDASPMNPGASGLVEAGEDLSKKNYRKAYRKQIDFLNRQVLGMLKETLAEANAPPVIILQSDHGPAFWETHMGGLLNPREETSVQPLRRDSLVFLERFSNFEAVYFQGKKLPDFYDEITPVNLFPLILNNLFGTDFELLEDRSFIEGGTDFIDVTKDLAALESRLGKSAHAEVRRSL